MDGWEAHDGGAGNWTQALWKSRRHSQPLRHLSSPGDYIWKLTICFSWLITLVLCTTPPVKERDSVFLFLTHGISVLGENVEFYCSLSFSLRMGLESVSSRFRHYSGGSHRGRTASFPQAFPSPSTFAYPHSLPQHRHYPWVSPQSLYFLFVCLFVWDIVSCSPGCTKTFCVAEDSLELQLFLLPSSGAGITDYVTIANL